MPPSESRAVEVAAAIKADCDWPFSGGCAGLRRSGRWPSGRWRPAADTWRSRSSSRTGAGRWWTGGYAALPRQDGRWCGLNGFGVALFRAFCVCCPLPESSWRGYFGCSTTLFVCVGALIQPGPRERGFDAQTSGHAAVAGEILPDRATFCSRYVWHVTDCHDRSYPVRPVCRPPAAAPCRRASRPGTRPASGGESTSPSDMCGGTNRCQPSRQAEALDQDGDDRARLHLADSRQGQQTAVDLAWASRTSLQIRLASPA